jgi:hypothetical protein
MKNNLAGRKFGRLTAVVVSRTDSRGRPYWECVCDCGNRVAVRCDHLLDGRTQSCGCYGKEQRRSSNTTHGRGNHKHRDPTYISWCSMKKRCTSPDAFHRKYYMECGVKVCDKWLNSFENFLADMGSRPKGTSLDRYPDKNGNYEPGNCRWATSLQQRHNRRDSA